MSERQHLVQAIGGSSNGICPVLRQTIPFGVAYHHSGLTMDERKVPSSFTLLCLITGEGGLNYGKRHIFKIWDGIKMR